MAQSIRRSVRVFLSGIEAEAVIGEMSYSIEIVEDEGPVRVGSTGTIGSLLCRELESIRRMEQKKKKSSWAPRNDAVSISCGRPLASLAGCRLGTRKGQDSNSKPRYFESSVTPRSSGAEAVAAAGEGRRMSAGKVWSKTLFDAGDFEGSKMVGYGPPRSEARRGDCSGGGMIRRQSVSLDCPRGASALAGMFDDESPSMTPGRVRKGRGGEFRTPMLRSVGKAADGEEGGARSARTSVERRGVGCSFVEVVDLKCNGDDRSWGSPIANRLRRLSFSRLSESVN